MVLPLILSDQGDIAVFETTRDLERYVESPDAFDYRIYDSIGQRCFFKGDRDSSRNDSAFRKVWSVQLDEEHVGPYAAEELAQLLRSYLHRVGIREPLISFSLQELIARTIEMTGYTR